MDWTTAQEKLHSIGQEQLLSHWDRLNQIQRQKLLAEIDSLDIQTYLTQCKLVKKLKALPSGKIEPHDDYALSGSAEDAASGWQLISQGKVGALVVAGGQGTRLGWDGPKGTFPVTPLKQKSLFQIVAERVRAASKRAGRIVPLAIMTSPLNDAETRAYFTKHRFFGLQPHQVAFFVQGSLPFVGDDSQLYLASEDSIAHGPDGNGGALHQFHSSEIWKQWAEAGVEYVIFQPIDNALADPYDAELIGYHARKQVEVTLKATQRSSAAEAVGVIAKRDGQIRVVEYTELPEEEQRAIRSDGQLKHAIANLSMFCFSMTFIEKLNQLPKHALPLHLAYKPVQVLGQAQPIKAWKCERFIFDVLEAATQIAVLVYPREDCFAPLKNQSGPDSLMHVQQALRDYGRRILQKRTGSIPVDDTELDPEDYYC